VSSKSRETLKGYFNCTLSVPTEAQYADLIDSMVLTGELDNLAKPTNFTAITTEVVVGTCEMVCADGVTRKFLVAEAPS